MKKLLITIFNVAFVGVYCAQTTLVSSGDTWKYLDNGSNQGTAWKAPLFNDASWLSGQSELGYGDGDETTIVSYGPNSAAKHTTTYFRKTINISNPSQYLSYILRMKRDDGIIVYLNGTEVYRNNLTGTVNYTTYASSAGDDGGTWLIAPISPTVFVSGNNTIATEIHQASASSSDITFNLELTGSTTVALNLKNIRWGSQNDPLNGLTVTWENSGLTDSIQWGYTTAYEQGQYPSSRRNANSAGNYFFKYTFPSAQANSIIYYKLYDSNANGWSAQNTYTTAPPVNTANFCFLAVGDSRSGLSVWNQISMLANSKNANFTIYNGDIVNDGNSNTDWDNWFSNGNQYIKNNLIYHSMGNHDIGASNYYANTFELPQNSGTNLYYSFNYGNSLFFCLNSEDPSNVAQYNWLLNTLQANQNATWKVVFFHRPFYTIGNHAGEMNPYFNTLWKAFDDYGVDLICNGHDHMYERTKPINRNISTIAPVTNYGSLPNQGRCQIVCGGAGAPLYTSTPNNFIQNYQSNYNFCEFCVNGNSLHCNVFDETDAIIDSFTIVKSLTTNVSNLNQHFNPISIYPNPVQKSFVVNCSSKHKGKGLLKIIDISGKEVWKEEIVKQNDVFNYEVSDLNIDPGVYFVELNVNNQKDVVLLIRN